MRRAAVVAHKERRPCHERFDFLEGRAREAAIAAELSQAIRQKMFTFEDLANLDTTLLQRILREVDMRELALALKSASEKLKATLLGCITKRAAESVQEEMTFMGPVRLRDIESAQMRVIEAVRRLEAEGAVDLGDLKKEGRLEMV